MMALQDEMEWDEIRRGGARDVATLLSRELYSNGWAMS